VDEVVADGIPDSSRHHTEEREDTFHTAEAVVLDEEDTASCAAHDAVGEEEDGHHVALEDEASNLVEVYHACIAVELEEERIPWVEDSAVQQMWLVL
jgi:hypothetical protein